MSSSTDTRRFAPLSAGPSADLPQQRQAARALGYAEGLSIGQRAAAAQAEAVQTAIVREHRVAQDAARADVERALAGLGGAARQLVLSSAPVIDEVGDAVLEAAIVLARAIIGAELQALDDAGVATLRRALRPLPTDARVTVRLNPTDHAQVLDTLGVDAPTAASAGTAFEAHDVRLVPDASLQRGDAVADQAGSVVDARVDAALGRALDVVRSGAWSL
jgi:flagellar assembly protein FliH